MSGFQTEYVKLNIEISHKILYHRKKRYFYLKMGRKSDMEYRVGVISGDGIGPEVVREAKKVLDQIGTKYGHQFVYEEILMGG